MTSSTDISMLASLGADPFTSVAIHYGMLLGVPDFQLISANPRGKLRLHQAWQHGPGVIWGLGVAPLEDGSTELQVTPGLAVDALGREMVIATDYCVDVAQWLDEQVEAGTIDAGAPTFNAQLILRFRACLARPVPSMSSTCDGGANDVAYSRIIETGELELRPYGNDPDGNPAPPPDDRDATFEALRSLVREGRLEAGDPAGMSWLEAFRLVAARTVIAEGPPAFRTGAVDDNRMFPSNEPGEIVLADLPGMSFTGTGADRELVTPVIDVSVRRSHVPTWVIEELIAEALTGGMGSEVATDAGGPRVTKIERAATTVTIELTAGVHEPSLAGGFELRSFDSGADPSWSTPATPALTYQASTTSTPATVTFDLPAEPTATVAYRMVLKGTGPEPVVAVDGGRIVPLAGRAGGPPASADDGRDVVHMFLGA